MADEQPIYVLDKASADAIKLATRNKRSRLEPTLVEEGPYAGQYMLPGGVVDDPRYSPQVKSMVTLTHQLVVVDAKTLWKEEVDVVQALDTEIEVQAKLI